MKIFIPLLVYLLMTGCSAFGETQTPAPILITFFSETGNTQAMAEAVARGVKEAGGTYLLKSIDEVQEEEILNAVAIIVGSPVYSGNVAPEVQNFMNSWPFEDWPLKDKIGAAFATGGGISIGEEAVLHSIHRSMMIHGMIIVGGDEVNSAFGASAVTAEGPFEGVDELFLRKAEGLGRRVVQLARKMKN